MKKVWQNPTVNNLSVEMTESGHIIATQQGSVTFDYNADGLWRWECTCCHDVGPYEHKTKELAIEAGKAEHGYTCPEASKRGCSA